MDGVAQALGTEAAWQTEWHGLLAWRGHGGQGDTGPWHGMEHGQECSCTKQNQPLPLLSTGCSWTNPSHLCLQVWSMLFQLLA